MNSHREQQLEKVIEQFLQPIKGIPFELVVKSLYKHEVYQFDKMATHNILLIDKLFYAMKKVCAEIKQTPIKRPRPNEVGNDIEPYVIKALIEIGLDASTPKTAKDKGKSTGYPDIYINNQPHPIYLEVKTYAKKNHGTTQRSFYLSPSEDAKITKNAHHLLVGFEVEKNGDLYHPVGFVIADLYGLECDMKSEFNSDNKRLYSPERIIAEG
jgi:hypothetical protein